MPRIRLWRNNKTNDYKFSDNATKEYFFMSGTQVYVHRFVGFIDDDGKIKDDIKIQDLLFMESRDRKYDEDVIELHGIYEISDNDFELSQFGFFQSDTLYIDFHLNDSVNKLGRKLTAGDVLELSHLRDDMLDSEEGAINAYFVVEEGRRAAEGYGPHWLPHVWRVRVRKIFDSREYNDILGGDGDDELSDLLSNYNQLININQQVVGEAEQEVPFNEEYADYIYDAARDGAPPIDPNIDLDDIPRLTAFPVDAEEGDYVIRKDYKPAQLFVREDGKWKIVDQEILREWTRGREQTHTFVNNDDEFCEDGEKRTSRTYITNPVKPIIDDEEDND